MSWNIKDYHLTAEQLDDRYNPDGDGQHRTYTRSLWVRAVNMDATLSGYWDWVHYQLTLEREELDADSPYA